MQALGKKYLKKKNYSLPASNLSVAECIYLQHLLVHQSHSK